MTYTTLGESAPDMDDPAQYTERTLAVSDNGEGEWIYRAYQIGWDYQPKIEEQVPDPEPEQPEQPLPDDSLVNPNKNEELTPEFTEKVKDAI